MNNGMNDATKIFELYLESKEEPIMTTTSDGAKMWYLHGKRHREDGPAIEWANGTKSWFINGKLHREDGPAIECADGTKEWWMHGKQLLEQEFINCNEPLELTLEQIAKKFNVSVNKLRIKD